MKLNIILKILVSITLLVYLILKIDIINIIHILQNIHPAIYILFAIPFLLVIFLNSISVYFLLLSINIKTKFKDIIKFKLLSRSFSLFFPGQLGELTLAPLLKTKKIPMGKSLAVITLDKIISLTLISLFAFYGFLLYFETSTGWKFIIPILLIIIIIPIILLSQKRRFFVRKYILRKYAKLFTGYSKNIRSILRKRKDALFIDVTMTLFWLVSTATIIKVLFMYFGFHVNIIEILAIQAIGALSSMVPISLSGLGVRESIAVYLYYKIGIDPAVVGTIFLLFLFASYLFSTITIIIASKNFSVKKLKSIVKEN
ncbi:flippase-like domain-containing protein [Candidatus Woesearchaeota archaeon]|jgi:glycosyltransferase 2 family protein|nr:flippase-like domain-containing protein [Candidatus Woesearchaeota archaeon]MBT5397262.1 flippase-like domain-containing protein [Candidatus Woesearchaeota archaeon]MBT6367192.1 flippase-like domain-containing protein [Candidatus Woesearchaeota archaeon]MBT7762662.1 flippase-like domain-containing protein [Candidatus Woesearchaeota archaeon]